MLIAHHKSALPMAQRTRNNGTNPQTRQYTQRAQVWQ